jgi:pimeloyl-ACP methyl ester carboxylesterase
MSALTALASNKSGKAGPLGTVAAVTWIGYDAPAWGELADPARSVALDRQAHTGGRALNHFFAGITANRVDDPHVTALGHSYGSLTTAIALQHGPVGVDDVVLFGSPGLNTSHVEDLHVPTGHAFVMEARNDPVADLAAFGPDPNQMGGVSDLSTAATRTSDGVQRTESVGHSGYLTDNSTSQYNLAVVMAGIPEDAAPGGQFGLGDAVNYPYTRIDQWLR